MDPNGNDIQASDVNEAPDLAPIELPGRNAAPSIEERVAVIESTLNINY